MIAFNFGYIVFCLLLLVLIGIQLIEAVIGEETMFFYFLDILLLFPLIYLCLVILFSVTSLETIKRIYCCKKEEYQEEN